MNLKSKITLALLGVAVTAWTLGGIAGVLTGVLLAWVLAREIDRTTRRIDGIDTAKRDLLASVTHELRSPLLAMESYTNLLLEEIRAETETADRERKKTLDGWTDDLWTVKNNAVRLGRFINDLLDASKIERGKMSLRKRLAALSPVIDETVKLFRARAASVDIRIDVRTEPSLPLVFADPDRIGQVIWNLVSNALKFTPAGGSISIDARRRPPGDLVEVSVSDTGSGIPPEALDRLFDPFYQSPNRDGTGLGLHIARTLIELHGGAILAENNESGGARLTFTLQAQTQTEKVPS